MRGGGAPYDCLRVVSHFKVTLPWFTLVLLGYDCLYLSMQSKTTYVNAQHNPIYVVNYHMPSSRVKVVVSFDLIKYMCRCHKTYNKLYVLRCCVNIAKLLPCHQCFSTKLYASVYTIGLRLINRLLVLMM